MKRYNLAFMYLDSCLYGHHIHVSACQTVKLRSHMPGAVAELRRVDFDIPAPLPRVCSHLRGADAGGSAISWGQRWFGARGLEADAENWVLDPFVAEQILLPLRDHACVNACYDLCWSQFSTRLRPHPRRACVNVPLGMCAGQTIAMWPFTIAHTLPSGNP